MFCKLKPLGANTIMPVLLRELSPLIFTVKDATLTECYVLLNDVQAYYIAKNGHPDNHYLRMEDTLLSLLDKFGLRWVVDQEALREYAVKFLKDKGFREFNEGFFSPESVKLDIEEQILLKSLVEEVQHSCGVVDLSETVCSKS